MQLNKIYNEDCSSTMQRMIDSGVKVDVVLTSPPYNTNRNYTSGNAERRMYRHDQRYLCYNDKLTNEEYITWTINNFTMLDKVLAPNGVVLYNLSYSAENTSLIWDLVSALQNNTNFVVADCIVWKKVTAVPNNNSSNKLTRICEFIFVLCRKTELQTFRCNKAIIKYRKDNNQAIYDNIYNFIEAPNNDGSCKIHKATYSTLLCRKLLSIYCPPTASKSVVYDPFMGTGTTAVACIKQGYDYVGSEICEEYVQFANDRINKELQIQTLF